MMIVYRMSLFEYFQTSFAATTRNPERSFGRGILIFLVFTCENSFVSFPRSMRESTKIVEHIDGREFTKSADDALLSRCLKIFSSTRWLTGVKSFLKDTYCVLFSHKLL